MIVRHLYNITLMRENGSIGFRREEWFYSTRTCSDSLSGDEPFCDVSH